MFTACVTASDTIVTWVTHKNANHIIIIQYTCAIIFIHAYTLRSYEVSHMHYHYNIMCSW